MKILILLVSCILSTNIFAEVICKIESKNSKVVVYLKKKGCEFPEDNIINCIFIEETIFKNKETTQSNAIFREGADFNAFCLSKKVFKRKNTSYRDISPNSASSISVLLKCPSLKTQATLEIENRINKDSKTCTIKL